LAVFCTTTTTTATNAQTVKITAKFLKPSFIRPVFALIVHHISFVNGSAVYFGDDVLAGFVYAAIITERWLREARFTTSTWQRQIRAGRCTLSPSLWFPLTKAPSGSIPAQTTLRFPDGHHRIRGRLFLRDDWRQIVSASRPCGKLRRSPRRR
jgi:hypothetical protein